MVRHPKNWPHAVLKKYGILSRVARPTFVWLGLGAIALLPGCQYSSHREAGTALGGGLGALTGAMIGQESGHAFGGAMIGALAGGITGSLIGNGEDLREQRDAAITHAQYLESTGQVLTNADVIRMVQSGLSDEVIIGTVRNSLGKYDLSPDATIQLKACGTSDQVILALQHVPKIRPVSAVSYVPSSPSVGLVVAPAPVVMFGRPRYHYYGGRHYRRY
jgi:hypothetical protein